ncbi:MAG: hypothetical protein WC571_03630, partial [Candidatus Omnitrophota bacterium]
ARIIPFIHPPVDSVRNSISYKYLQKKYYVEEIFLYLKYKKISIAKLIKVIRFAPIIIGSRRATP